MPWYVETKDLIEDYPSECPYCGGVATTTFRQPFARVIYKKRRARSETLTLALPACASCAKWFRITRPIMFALGFAALSGALWSVPAMSYFGPDPVGAFWAFLVGGWAMLRVWRLWRRTSLRLASFGNGRYVYATRNRSYAERLASKPGRRMFHELFLFNMR